MKARVIQKGPAKIVQDEESLITTKIVGTVVVGLVAAIVS